MATLVPKDINGGGADYSTVQLWEDAIPDFTSIDEYWEGSLYGEVSGTGTLVSFSAHNNTSTRFWHLMAASGEGLDTPASQALAYDGTLGAAQLNTGGYSDLFLIAAANDYLKFTGVQFKSSGGSINGMMRWTGVADNATVKKCLGQMTGSLNAAHNTIVFAKSSNSLFESSCFIQHDQDRPALRFDYGTAGTISFCTIVAPSDLSNSAAAIVLNNSTNLVINSTAIFGFASGVNLIGSGSTASTGSGYNSTDLASGLPTAGGGAANQYSLTFTSQFVTTTVSGMDFQAVASGSLDAFGDPTAPPTDIYGQTRAASPYCGAHEIVSGGGGATPKGPLGLPLHGPLKGPVY